MVIDTERLFGLHSDSPTMLTKAMQVHCLQKISMVRLIIHAEPPAWRLIG